MTIEMHHGAFILKRFCGSNINETNAIKPISSLVRDLDS
jgi:hypothetical protein